MKSMLFRLFSVILLGGLILNSCQNDEKLLLTNDLHEGLIDTKVLKSATESQGCIDPSNPDYAVQSLQSTILWGAKRNPFEKTVYVNIYNTLENFVVEVMSTNGWVNLIVSGSSVCSGGPVSENTWESVLLDLPDDWQAGDLMEFELKVTGNGPMARFDVSYALLGACSTFYGSVTDNEGRSYSTVVLGELEWMRENLGTLSFNNGDLIPTNFSVVDWVSNQGPAVEIYCPIEWGVEGPEMKPMVLEHYGALYNFAAVIDPRGICPDGWRVPTKEDWLNLKDHVRGFYPDEIAGNALRSCRQENSPLGGDCSTVEHPYWIDPGNGVYGFDALGFSAIPGGWRNEIGGFGNLGHEAHYWSCTDANHFDGVFYHSFAFGIRVSQEDFYMFDEIQPIAMGVRCVRDR